VGLTFAQCDYKKEDAKTNIDRELAGKLDGYVIAQEVHQDGGLHLHLYLKFKDKINYKDPNCFDFIVAGTQHANIQALRYPKKWVTYCRKSDESPIIEGDVAEDLTWNEVLNAATREDCFNKLLEVRPRDAALNADRVLRGWQLNKQINKKRAYEEPEKPIVWAFFGKSGHGKTHAVKEYAKKNKLSMKKITMQQLKAGWYTGWGQEDIMFLDEFTHDVIKPRELLALLDGPDEVPIKGGSTPFGAKILAFTSPDHPIAWYKNWIKEGEETESECTEMKQLIPNNQEQLLRRFTKVTLCTRITVAGQSQYEREEIRRENEHFYKAVEPEVFRVS